MAPQSHELNEDDEPPSINPYEVLGVPKTATSDQIKSAYRKAALKHHPDKAPEHLKTTAHSTFQSIAFAYAILSDSTRRTRYDKTGSTEESIVDSDDFSWSEYYGQQYRDAISADAIETFSKQYKNSEEEKSDLLAAFTEYHGSLNQIFETIMLSDPLEDEERFRTIIDAAIEAGEVEPYKAYTKESAKSKAARVKAARKEGAEAEEHAKELGIHDKLFGKKKGTGSEDDALKAMILKRQEDRGSFLDRLEAKYAGGDKGSKAKGKTKKGKKRSSPDEGEDVGEPSEEAFQAAAARLKAKAGDEVGTGASRKSKRTKRG